MVYSWELTYKCTNYSSISVPSVAQTKNHFCGWCNRQESYDIKHIGLIVRHNLGKNALICNNVQVFVAQ